MDSREKDGELYCLRCHDKMGIPICGACRWVGQEHPAIPAAFNATPPLGSNGAEDILFGTNIDNSCTKVSDCWSFKRR